MKHWPAQGAFEVDRLCKVERKVRSKMVPHVCVVFTGMADPMQ